MKLRLSGSFLVAALLLCFFTGMNVMAKKSSVAVGDKAPEFSLPAQDGSTVNLKDFANKDTVILYFYPKDNTSVCTKEACSFRDQYSVFSEKGAVVLGVSSDSVASHKDFADAQHLPFKLLSDSNGDLRKLYGVPSTMKMLPGRVTYVIDPSGTVRLVFNSMLDAKKHVDEALKVLDTINAAKKST
jgi:peroxiredoxin Q/BCP